MILQDEFCSRLRAARKKLGLTQAEFGSLAGVTHGSQSRFEKGQQKPGLEYLSNLAEAGVDVNFILTGKHPADFRSNDNDQNHQQMREWISILEKVPEEKRLHAIQVTRSTIIFLVEEWQESRGMDKNS